MLGIIQIVAFVLVIVIGVSFAFSLLEWVAENFILALAWFAFLLGGVPLTIGWLLNSPMQHSLESIARWLLCAGGIVLVLKFLSAWLAYVQTERNKTKRRKQLR